MKEAIDEIIFQLDEIARQYDPHQYGLPVHSKVELEKLRKTILELFNKQLTK